MQCSASKPPRLLSHPGNPRQPKVLKILTQAQSNEIVWTNETKGEIAQPKDLFEAKAKLIVLSNGITEISDVMEKIETAQGRLQKVEQKLFLEGFGKKPISTLSVENIKRAWK